MVKVILDNSRRLCRHISVIVALGDSHYLSRRHLTEALCALQGERGLYLGRLVRGT